MTEKKPVKSGVTKPTRSGATKAAKPIKALAQFQEVELVLDSQTLDKIDSILAKSGGKKSGLTQADVIAHLLLEKNPNGFKFEVKKNLSRTIKVSLPMEAVGIAEKSAKKSGQVEISEVVKEVVARY